MESSSSPSSPSPSPPPADESDDGELELAMELSLAEKSKKEQEELEEALRLINQVNKDGTLTQHESMAMESGAWNSEGDGRLGSMSMESSELNSMTVQDYQKRMASRKNYDWKEVDPNSGEYQEIKEPFDAAGVKVTRIRKVRNPQMLKKFEAQGFQIQEEKPKGFDLNVRMLYHGSTASEKQVCLEGLDSRLSKKGHFGTGIYFSDNPRKCAQFISKGGASRSSPYILRCRVILGDVKEYLPGQMDMGLRREPVKTVIDDIHIYYDSVKGMPNKDGLCEFVIYESRSALIEHIINYDPHGSPEISNPGVPSESRAVPAAGAVGGSEAGAVGGSDAGVVGGQSAVVVDGDTSTIESSELFTLDIDPADDVMEPPTGSDVNESLHVAPPAGGILLESSPPLNISGEPAEEQNDLGTAKAAADSQLGDVTQNVAPQAAGEARENPTQPGDDKQMKRFLQSIGEQLKDSQLIKGDDATNQQLFQAFQKTYSHPQFQGRVDIYSDAPAAAAAAAAEDKPPDGDASASDSVDGPPAASITPSDPQNDLSSPEIDLPDFESNTVELAEDVDPVLAVRLAADVEYDAEPEIDCVQELLDSLVLRFIEITECSDLERARNYIELSNMELHDAIAMFMDDQHGC